MQGIIQKFSLFITSKFQVLIGIVALFATSQISIPLYGPIPITLQTLAVIFIGLTYQPLAAWQTLWTWLGLAAAGFPLLENYQGGIDIFLGPRGGYLLGMGLAAPILAFLKEKIFLLYQGTKFSKVLLLISCFICHALIFICGVFRLSQFIGWNQALIHGLFPFLLGEYIKISMIMLILRLKAFKPI